MILALSCRKKSPPLKGMVLCFPPFRGVGGSCKATPQSPPYCPPSQRRGPVGYVPTGGSTRPEGGHMSDDYEDLFAELDVKQQQMVARGEVDLEELLDQLTLSYSAELCPRCAVNHLVPGTPAYARGICPACLLRHLRDRQQERLVELEALREYNAAKKAVQRVKDDIDPNRVRRPGPKSKKASDYGRTDLVTSGESRPLTRCERCGRTMVEHNHGHAICVFCADRVVGETPCNFERRQSPEAGAEGSDTAQECSSRAV